MTEGQTAEREKVAVKGRTVRLEADRYGRVFLPLPAEVMSRMGLRLGDWLEIRKAGGGLELRKVNMVSLKVRLPPETLEEVYKYRDSEGYYTDEEAIANLVEKGLVIQLERSKDRKLRESAEKLRGRTLVQIHAAGC